jgi:hypothetical protein
MATWRPNRLTLAGFSSFFALSAQEIIARSASGNGSKRTT